MRFGRLVGALALALSLGCGSVTLERKSADGHSGRGLVVLTGAGVSTSAGIPDFRTPKTGVYDNLDKYKLPTPSSIFEIDFFIESP